MTINRREMAKTLAAAGVISAFRPLRARASDQHDVIIIGAGMAGLYAAMLLEEQGVDVLVVEAQPHVGGRMYTLDQGNDYFNCGATTLGPYYGRVRDAADRASVELVEPTRRAPMTYHINGQLLTEKDWISSPANLLVGDERALLPDRLEFPIMAKLNKIDDITEWYTEENLAYDSVPLDSFFRDNGVSDEAIKFIGHISNTNSLSTTSALFQMREMARLQMWLTDPKDKDAENRPVYEAGASGQFHYIKGGTQRLAEKMAASLSREVALDQPVAAIHLTDKDAEVRCLDGSRYRGKQIIATVPFNILRHVDIDPQLRGLKRDAIWNSVYTKTTHVFFEIRKPYWDDTGAPGLFTDTMFERVFANRGASGEAEWLDCWINGNNAARLDALSKNDQEAFVTEKLIEIRPSMKGKIKAIGSYSWGNNPYIAGNKQIFTPGQMRPYVEIMAEPVGRLRFAGEHTRSFEAGLEAAAKSGEREALAVLDRL